MVRRPLLGALIHFFGAKRRTSPIFFVKMKAWPNSAFPDFLSSLTHGGPPGPQFRAELPYSALTYSDLHRRAADLQLDTASAEYKPIIALAKEACLVEETSTPSQILR